MALAGDDFFIEPSGEEMLAPDEAVPEPGSMDICPPSRAVPGWLTQDVEPMRRWLIQQMIAVLRTHFPGRLDLAMANAQLMSKWAFATLFSGCDGVHRALQSLVRVLCEMPVDAHLTLNSVLVCESIEWKLRFAYRQSKPSAAVSNAEDLLSEPTYGVSFLEGKKRLQKYIVPTLSGGDWLIAGWPCKDYTRKNHERRKFATGLRDGVGKSGSAFQALAAFAGAHRPVFLSGENAVLKLLHFHIM